jgi:hypothetical protein
VRAAAEHAKKLREMQAESSQRMIESRKKHDAAIAKMRLDSWHKK